MGRTREELEYHLYRCNNQLRSATGKMKDYLKTEIDYTRLAIQKLGDLQKDR